jgi:hypothetical protein
MKKHKSIGILLLIAIIIPTLAHAASLGGRVVSGPTQLQATIICNAAYGPFMMMPFNFAVSGPFFIRKVDNGTPRLSGFLLGQYTIIPDLSTCFTPEGIPVPAFEIKPRTSKPTYGVSR